MKILLIYFLLIQNPLYASSEHSEKGTVTTEGHIENHENHEGEHEEAVELPAGVTSFNDEKSEFELKENVIRNFGVTYVAVIRNGTTFKVPQGALIRSLKKTTIFTFDKNKYRSVEVKIMTSINGIVFVSSEIDLTDKRIVLKGNNFLQTVLLSLEEGPSEGHGH